MNKPVTLLRNATGQGLLIKVFAPKRKGQAFKSPPQPNKRTGTAAGDCVSRGRLTVARCVRGNHGKAAWPTVERRLDAGRNREQPGKNQRSVRLVRHGRVYKRRTGSGFMGWLSKPVICWAKNAFATGKESYVYRSRLHQVYG